MCAKILKIKEVERRETTRDGRINELSGEGELWGGGRRVEMEWSCLLNQPNPPIREEEEGEGDKDEGEAQEGEEEGDNS